MIAASVSVYAYFRESARRRDSEIDAANSRSIVNRIFQSQLPDWSSPNGISLHGSAPLLPSFAEVLDQSLSNEETTPEEQSVDKAFAIDLGKCHSARCNDLPSSGKF